MKKDGYVDYTKSDYFMDDSTLLKDVEAVEKSKKTVIFVQEFSKKVVVITFLLYVIGTIVSFGMIMASYQLGMITGIDTFISELNQTCRDIIGGYLIKSMVQNSFSIAGNYFVGVSNAKLRILEHKLYKKAGIEDEVIDEVGPVDTEEDF